MKQNSHFERKNRLGRIKELLTLSLFILVSAVISIVVMDILVLPLSLFAINRKTAFNYIIRDVSLFIILFIVILLLIRKVIRLYRDGFKIPRIARYLLVRPLRGIVTFFLILVASGIIIYLITLLLNFNYYRIYIFTQI